jgi:hypothetical protein
LCAFAELPLRVEALAERNGGAVNWFGVRDSGAESDGQHGASDADCEAAEMVFTVFSWADHNPWWVALTN